MTDNQLFTHFKLNGTVFDEMPDAALWQKIENGLNTKPAVKHNPFLFLGFVIVVLSGGAFFILSHKSETVTIPRTLQQTKQSVSAKAITDIKANTVVNKESAKAITTDSVKKIRFKVITAPTAKPIPFTTILNKDSLKQTEVKVRTPLIKIQDLPAKAIVTTTEQLTPEEFNELKISMTEKYKGNPGTLIIIKAPGYKPFRETIVPNPATLKRTDSLRLISADSVIHFIAPNPVLQPINGTIQFKQQKKSLKEE